MATYVLEILDGDRAGETLSVADRTLRIGRKAGNDLVLADEKTSGVHAEVVLEGDRHVLRDLGSTNGTFLDGKRVTEIVLTPGDVVTIGRIRVKFRQEGGAAGAPDAGDLAVRRLDAGRLQRRGGSFGLVLLLAIVALGAGGWFFWQKRTDSDGGPSPARTKAPVAVEGNRLAGALASCESEEGWNLRAAGSAFQSTGRAHTGTGAFEATRGEGAEAPDFAVLRLAEPTPVLAGRTMTLVAHVQTEGDARVALRAHLFPAGDQGPFRFVTGAPFAAHGQWERVEAVVAVPSGCDRLLLEVVALLGDGAAIARVDDVALLEAGQGAAAEHKVVEQKLAESAQTLIGTGSSLAVRSTDPDTPATLLAIGPAAVPPAMTALDRAGLCALSDLGATIAVETTDRTFRLAATGSPALQFVFPAESAGGLLIASDGGTSGSAAADGGGFTSAPAESEFRAQRIVLGDRSTRVLLRFEEPVACRGQLGGGRYRLVAETPKTELVLGFRAERMSASDLVRQARGQLAEGHAGKALDLLRELARTVPYDSEVLSQAQGLRTEILAEQSAVLRRLQQDLDESTFFDTRGGFERVVAGVDDLIAAYGESNLEDGPGVNALRARAATRLAQLDGADAGQQRRRLEALAKAFEAAQQTGLASLVDGYWRRNFGDQAPGDSTGGESTTRGDSATRGKE